MVKKKSPVIPLTFAAIGVAIAFAVNSRLHPVDPKDEAAQAQKAQEKAQAQTSAPMRAPDNSKDVHAALAQSLTGPQKGPKPMAKGMGAPDGDLMVGKTQVIAKPKPSSTNTTAQWYNDHSH